MNIKSEFYKLLVEAESNDVALIRVIEQIMPLINKNAYYDGKLDEDLKSELIAFTINILKNKKIYKNF